MRIEDLWCYVNISGAKRVPRAVLFLLPSLSAFVSCLFVLLSLSLSLSLSIYISLSHSLSLSFSFSLTLSLFHSLPHPFRILSNRHRGCSRRSGSCSPTAPRCVFFYSRWGRDRCRVYSPQPRFVHVCIFFFSLCISLAACMSVFFYFSFFSLRCSLSLADIHGAVLTIRTGRNDGSPIGTFTINLMGVPENSRVPQALHQVISQILPRSVVLSVDIKALNSGTYLPYKDFDLNRLQQGSLQVTKGYVPLFSFLSFSSFLHIQSVSPAAIWTCPLVLQNLTSFPLTHLCCLPTASNPIQNTSSVGRNTSDGRSVG